MWEHRKKLTLAAVILVIFFVLTPFLSFSGEDNKLTLVKMAAQENISGSERTFRNVSMEIRGHMGEEEKGGPETQQITPVNFQGNFSQAQSWSSSDGWRSDAVSLWNGAIVENAFQIGRGKTEAHLALKFEGVTEFSEISLQVRIPNPGNSDVQLAVATHGQPEEINKLTQGGEWVKIEKPLKDGVNTLSLEDIEWKKYTYFKVYMEKDSVDVSSPSLENVEIK